MSIKFRQPGYYLSSSGEYLELRKLPTQYLANIADKLKRIDRDDPPEVYYEVLSELSSREFRKNTKGVWLTGDKVVIEIKDLEDDHLTNIINFFESNYDKNKLPNKYYELKLEHLRRQDEKV